MGTYERLSDEFTNDRQHDVPMKRLLGRASRWVEETKQRRMEPLDGLQLSIRMLRLILLSTTASPRDTYRTVKLLYAVMCMEARLRGEIEKPARRVLN